MHSRMTPEFAESAAAYADVVMWPIRKAQREAKDLRRRRRLWDGDDSGHSCWLCDGGWIRDDDEHGTLSVPCPNMEDDK